MFGVLRRHGPAAFAAKRHLSYVRARTRDLIDVANRASSESVPDTESTRPRDVLGVRAITIAQRELLRAIEETVECGVGVERIAAEGVRPTVERALVVSDLAWEALDHVMRTVSGSEFRRAG